MKAVFEFSSQAELDAVVKAAKRIGIDLTPEVQEDAPPGLGQTVASTMVSGLDKTKKLQQQQQKKKPITRQDKAIDDMASELDNAMERNPALMRNMKQSMQQMGLKVESFDSLSLQIFKSYLKEGTWDSAKLMTRMFAPHGNLFENTVDAISMQIMELLVTMKAQGVKDIPLNQLVKTIQDSDIDLDPNQDMEFFVDLLASLPVVRDVNPSTNRVFLEMPGQPEDSDKEAEEEAKVVKKDNIKSVATDKAKDNIQGKDKPKPKKPTADNLFASVEYNNRKGIK